MWFPETEPKQRVKKMHRSLIQFINWDLGLTTVQKRSKSIVEAPDRVPKRINGCYYIVVHPRFKVKWGSSKIPQPITSCMYIYDIKDLLNIPTLPVCAVSPQLLCNTNCPAIYQYLLPLLKYLLTLIYHHRIFFSLCIFPIQAQFILCIVHTIRAMLAKDCEFPKFISALLLLNASIFFVLFMNFYIQNYKKRRTLEAAAKTTEVTPAVEAKKVN